MPFGPTHTFLRSLATSTATSFFSRVHVDGGDEFVPRTGPVVVISNHHNSAVDPAILSCFFPHTRKLHYWAKSTLFVPGLARTILLDAGNIPVDRRTKDNQKLFAKTFDSLKYGECIAVFPEGGSETMPAFSPLKDGASWAALEYSINIRNDSSRTLSDGTKVKQDPRDVVIVVAGLNFTDKTKYRSSAIMQFGATVAVEPFVAEFQTDPKAAVKKLTARLTEELTKLTINAPDWDTLNAAGMARRMLWVDERDLPLARYRDIMQNLVDLFSTASDSPKLLRLRQLLLMYAESLKSTSLTHVALAQAGVPLPSTLDPALPHPLPTRLRVVGQLAWATARSLSSLPFFAVPLVVHMPIYIFGSFSLRCSDLDEDKAQNKMAFGLALGLVTYVALFFFAWGFLYLTWFGAPLAVGIVWLFMVYHNTMIDDNYNKFKALRASWLVLVGIWAPHAKHEAVAAINRKMDDFEIDKKIRGMQEAFAGMTTPTRRRATSRTRDGSQENGSDTPQQKGQIQGQEQEQFSGVELERRLEKARLNKEEKHGNQGGGERDNSSKSAEQENQNRHQLTQRNEPANDSLKGENQIRRVLRLRLEASRALREYLREEVDSHDGTSKGLRSTLESWGAKI